MPNITCADLGKPVEGTTTLRGIEKHRLHELILRDLSIYRKAAISEIHARIGPEIARRKVQRALADLVKGGNIKAEGERRGRRYLFVPKPPESNQNGTNGQGYKSSLGL